MTASLAELLDEMAATMLAVVGPAVTETEVQVVGRRNFNPTPPSIDIYPGDPFRDTPSAGFTETGGELLLTVRARVSTVDNIAGQELLLRLMDDEDAIGVASTLMEDQTLNGLASSVYVEGQHGLRPVPRPRPGRGRLPRLRVARPRAAAALVSLWFVVPAHGRLRADPDLPAAAAANLRRARRIEATAVVVACDENLDTARELGFATVQRDNQFLARRYNDGLQLALDPD